LEQGILQTFIGSSIRKKMAHPVDAKYGRGWRNNGQMLDPKHEAD
jgi:hypothetical protein